LVLTERYKPEQDQGAYPHQPSPLELIDQPVPLPDRIACKDRTMLH
jgi:hypothetical protein